MTVRSLQPFEPLPPPQKKRGKKKKKKKKKKGVWRNHLWQWLEEACRKPVLGVR